MKNLPLLFIQNLGATEILLIILAILLLFGAKKIPELARSLGKGVKEFKKGIAEVTDEVEKTDEGKAEGKKSEPPPQSRPGEKAGGGAPPGSPGE